MKNMTFGIALVCALLLIACDNITDAPEIYIPQMPIESGYGRISIGFIGEMAYQDTLHQDAPPQSARTVMPPTAFDKYVYTFTKTGATTGVVKTPGNDGLFTLEVGSYTVAVQAYIGTKEPYTMVASGVSEQFIISSGDNAQVEVKLSGITATTKGKFSYTITYPAGAAAEITLQKWPELNTITLNPVSVTQGNGKTQTLELSAGSYLLTVLVNKNNLFAGISEAVRIYPSVSTVYTKDFAVDDMFQITAPMLTLTAGNTKITYTWTASNPVADSYDVYWKEGNDLTVADVKTGTKITGVSSGGEITGLTNGTAYSVVVMANKAGYSVDSAVQTATPSLASFTTAPILTLTAGNTKITYTWTASNPAADSYDVYWKAGNGLTAADIKTGTKITGATSGGEITGLTNGTVYSVVVTANKAGYNAVDSTVRTVTPSLASFTTAPTLTLTAGNTKITYTWTASNPTADSYDIYWKAGSGLTVANVKTGTKITGVASGGSISGLINGTAYSVVVTANKAGYNSIDSAVRIITVPIFFNSIADLDTYLKGRPANTAATPYSVALNVADLGSYSSTVGSLGYVLQQNKTKYVDLDLSGSTFTSLSVKAFDGCTSLTSVTIPDSVSLMGSFVFQDCTSLTSVTFPTNALFRQIGSNAFRGCSSLTSVTIPNSVIYIDETFSGCTGLTSVTIPNSVTSIGAYAFSGCTSLTSITIPNSITSIGGSAFGGCTSLTSVTIPDSVTSIGEEAFRGCTSLTSVTIPNSVTSIGGSAFRGCTSLTSVTIPNSVTSIGNYAFYGCTGLTSVTFTATSKFTSIGNYAFFGCTKLTSVTIPNSVTSIGDQAFQNCTSLTSITIPNSVTSIGETAFANCASLTSITIPNSVTSIGETAFAGCTGLTSIIVDAANTTYISDGGVLYNKNKTTLIQYPAGKTNSTFTIPNSVTSIGNQAFDSCTGLTSVTIPSSVTSIGDSAFTYCRGLISVTFSTGSAITSANFKDSTFPQDSNGTGGNNLKTAYLSGGAGTYKRTSTSSSTWTKQ